MRLRLNMINNSNDPTESLPLHFYNIKNVLPNNNFIENTYENFKKANEVMRRSSKILSFCQDYQIEDSDNILYGQGGYINRMWTQYGENHHGICLEINKEIFEQENSLIFEDKKLFKLEPIIYKANRVFSLKLKNSSTDPSLYLNSNEFIEENYKNYLFTKDYSWCTEHEFRIVKLFSDDSINEYLSINKSLNRILVGLFYPEDALKTLESIITNKEIRIERIDFKYNKLSSMNVRQYY